MTTINRNNSIIHAGVAKLADALALGASEVTHGGSSPLPGTIKNPERDFFVPGAKRGTLCGEDLKPR